MCNGFLAACHQLTSSRNNQESFEMFLMHPSFFFRFKWWSVIFMLLKRIELRSKQQSEKIDSLKKVKESAMESIQEMQDDDDELKRHISLRLNYQKELKSSIAAISMVNSFSSHH